MPPLPRSPLGPCLIAAAFALVACQRPPAEQRAGDSSPAPQAGAAAFRSAIGAGEWELVELGGVAPPRGDGGRRATLRFEADTARAGGFAGCNGYGTHYEVRGDSLRFGPVTMTRKFCAEGMELERGFAGALEATRRYELGAGGLTLHGNAGPLARLARRAPQD